MVAKIHIGKLNVRGTLRHRFEKEKDFMTKFSNWRQWELGIWFKKYKAVGEKNFENTSEWSKNLANVYTVGINLLVVKMWVDIDYGVKHL